MAYLNEKEYTITILKYTILIYLRSKKVNCFQSENINNNKMLAIITLQD